MAGALDDELTRARMVPFLWLAEHLAGEAKSLQFFAAVAFFKDTIAPSAMVIGSLTAAQQRRFRLQDPTLREDLTDDQRAALAHAAATITVDGQPSEAAAAVERGVVSDGQG